MPKIDSIVKSIEKSILIFLVICMVFLGMAQIISRFIIHKPIPWTEAMLTYMFVWTCFVGASLAVAESAHFSVEVIVVRFSPSIQRVIMLAVNSIVMAFGCLMIYKGMLLVEGNTDQLMSAMPFTMVWPYLAMPVSGLFIVVHSLTAIYNLVIWRA